MILSQDWAALAGDFLPSPSRFELVFVGSQIPVFVAIRSSQSHSTSISLTALVGVVAASLWTVLFLASFRINAFDPSGVLLGGLGAALWLASASLMAAADFKAFGLLRDAAKSRQAFGNYVRQVGWLTGLGVLLQLAVFAIAYKAVVLLSKAPA